MRVLVPLVLVASLLASASASVFGQALPPPFSCARGATSCSDQLGNTIYGGYAASTNTFQDLNPADSGHASGSNLIFGAYNSLSASFGENMISGWENTASGQLGKLAIVGEENNVHSDDANISITGAGNTVTGTQGENWGLTINGGSNQVDSSSGTIDGTANTVSKMTRGTVAGYSNKVSNSSDPAIVGNGNKVSNANDTAVLGDGNTVSGDRGITVGSGNTNTASEGVVVGDDSTNHATGGIVLGNHSGLGPDATNSVALGNDTYTDRADTVDVGNRTISGVAAGVLPDDAVNLGQLQAGIAQANLYTDQRFGLLNTRINQAGAAASALGLVAATAAGNPSGNRLAMGFSNYNGQSGVALAYQHIFATRHPINFTLGASFSGGERAVGAAASIGF